MFEINWVQIGVGFIIGVISSYLVCDLVFPVSNKDE
jgi:hypothetical protein